MLKRLSKLAAAAAVLAAAVAAAAEPAIAQSLLQRLFGPSTAESGARSPEYRSERMGTDGYMRRYDGYEDYSAWPEDLAGYNTMCVRLCDGFYFPMGYGVRRERLYRDARACVSRCDGEARLFYFPTEGGSVETMVDLAGRPYARLPNAFRYRRSLVSGCACRPAPWSGEATARHDGYAAGEVYARAEPGVGAENETRLRPPAPQVRSDDEPPAGAAYADDADAAPYEERQVYVEPPRYRQSWPRYTRLPRTPWGRPYSSWRAY